MPDGRLQLYAAVRPLVSTEGSLEASFVDQKSSVQLKPEADNVQRPEGGDNGVAVAGGEEDRRWALACLFSVNIVITVRV